MATKNPNKIIIHKTYAEMIVEHYWLDLKVKISLEDVDRVKNLKWTCKSSIDSKYKYFSSSHNGKKVSLHRFIMDCPANMVVDHINHRTLDNRRCNLRICTQSENMQNLKTNKRNKSGYKNIYKVKNYDCWRFQKNINGKRVSFCSKDLNKVLEYRNNFLGNIC